MSFRTTGTIASARPDLFAKYRHYLLSTASTAFLIAAACSGAHAQQANAIYVNADGSKTSDLEAAAATWRADKEFQANWGVGAMKAEYAYARGITGYDATTGKRVKIGIVDSGFYNPHSEFSPTSRYHAVFAKDPNAAPDPNNPDGVSGNWISGVNDSHGTKVTGVISAARNGTGVQGVAFDADIYVGNTNATDALLFGPAPQAAFPKSSASYLAAVYDAVAAQDVRIISNSWGSQPADQNYSTLAKLFAAYQQYDGKNTWIEGAARASTDKNGKEGIINNFSAGNSGYDNASLRGSLPYFRPELEGHWMTTTGFANNQKDQIYNRCGIAKYWCIMAPTIVQTTDTNGGLSNGFNGTSAAAPHASAALALIMQRFPYMTNEQALSVLFTTAQNMVASPDVAPTTGTRSRTPVVPGTAQVPNAVTGWGLVDLNKAMNGPGQFLGRFDANLGAGVSDSWSNNISDVAIRARQTEDKAEHDEWETTKTTKGWQNGLPANASDADRTEYTTKTARDEAFKTRQYFGSLIKSGTGTLRLTGTNTYTGDTQINGGLLAVDGSIASVVSVNNNGALGGIGTVGSLGVHAGGIVAPGNSVGTLHVAGDASFDKGSGLVIQLGANGTPDVLDVKGEIHLLGGVVIIAAENGTEALSPAETLALLNKSYKIVTFGSREGKFDTVLPQYYFIGGALSYNANDVNVTLSQNGLSFADAGRTKNQKAAATGVESLGLGNPLYNTIAVTRLGENLPAYFDALSGEVHASLKGILAEDGKFVRDAASNRIRAAFGDTASSKSAMPVLAYGPDQKKGSAAFASVEPATPTTALWGEASGSWSDVDSNGNASAYSRNTGGFVTGFDGVIADTWRFGLLAGYGNTSVHTDRGRASADTYQVGVYGGTKIDALTLSFGTSLAHHEIDTRRKVVFSGINDNNTADYSAKSVQVFGEAAYQIDTAYAAFEPFAAVAYTHLKTDGFTETGGITALSGRSDTTDLTTTTLGLRASHRFIMSDTTVLTARGMAGWRHAFGDTTPEASLAFSGGNAFSVDGLPVAEDTALVEAGLDFGIGKATTLGVSYTGQFSSQSHDNAVKADLTVRF
ncbi:autotransporter domain-containing protein [Phyllobacterium sp. TAF24]|uniref:autotransporter domain-containing protein n=1 Tax=Phyllobacterium sp. TAF24 TaxID=3233068 RepID=UPI003F9DAB19